MPLDANIRSSAYLRNHLTSSILQICAIIPHAKFHIAPCKTCLIALRNMPDRTSIPYVSQDDTWSFATRMGIFRKTNAQKHVFHSAKMPVSRSISPRNANHLLTKIITPARSLTPFFVDGVNSKHPLPLETTTPLPFPFDKWRTKGRRGIRPARKGLPTRAKDGKRHNDVHLFALPPSW